MRKITALVLCLCFFTTTANANGSTLLPEPVIAALAQEISGETAKRNLEFLARHHRMRGSSGFRAAAAPQPRTKNCGARTGARPVNRTVAEFVRLGRKSLSARGAADCSISF